MDQGAREGGKDGARHVFEHTHPGRVCVKTPGNTPNFSWGMFHFYLRQDGASPLRRCLVPPSRATRAASGARERNGTASPQRRVTLNLTIPQLKLGVFSAVA